MKVVVSTVFAQNYFSIADVTLDNNAAYAKKQGYEFDAYVWSSSDIWFQKHHHFDFLFKTTGADVIFYLDVDALITNHNIRIEKLIDEQYHYFLTRDLTELNNGVCIIRNTPEGRSINDRILNGKGTYPNEQNAINAYMSDPDFSQYVKVLPQGDMNAYKYFLYPECTSHVGREDLGDWVEGKSFVLHVPALSIEKRIEVLKNTPIIK
jgi:hypothetical protein